MAVPAGHPEKPQGDDGRAMLERMNTGAHEQLARWGLDRLDVVKGARILDVGCGGGGNIARMLEMADDVFVAGMDYAPLAVNMSREVNEKAIAEGRCTIKAASVDSIPDELDDFDLVTAFETIYFWPDLPAALAEIHRVLKDEGLFLICNEANGMNEAANEIAREIDEMTVYTADDLRTALEAAQFQVIEIEDEGEAGRIAVVARSLA